MDGCAPRIHPSWDLPSISPDHGHLGTAPPDVLLFLARDESFPDQARERIQVVSQSRETRKLPTFFLARL